MMNTHSPLTVSGIVSSSGGGAISLTAGASGSSADILTISGTGTVSTSGASCRTLTAGEAIQIASGAVVSGGSVVKTPNQNEGQCGSSYAIAGQLHQRS